MPSACFVTITVPSTTNGNVPVPAEEYISRVDNIMRYLAGLFGGATAVRGRGCWRNDEGVYVYEDVTLVTSYCSAGEFSREYDGIIDALYMSRVLWGQDCVAITTHEGMVLV